MANPYQDEGLLAQIVGLLSPSSAEAFYAGPNAAEWASAPNKFEGKYDKKPRFEMDDSKATVSLPDTSKSNTAILGEVLDHKELYRNYPYFADIPVEFVKGYESRGSFDGTTIRIKDELSDAEKKKVLFHEVQHTIQDYEGFARGGSLVSKLVNDINLREFKWQAEYDLGKTTKALASPWTNPYSGATSYLAPKSIMMFDPFRNDYKLQDIFNSNEYEHMPYDFETEKTLLARVDTLKKRIQLADHLLEKYKVTGSPSLDESFEFYKNLSGEIEARDVAARSDYDMSQRQMISPYSSENIPENEAFNLFR